MNKILSMILLGLLVVLGALALNKPKEGNINDLLYVQSICDRAHSEIDGNSERACGNAQRETNTEYLCTARTNDSYCWVESK